MVYTTNYGLYKQLILSEIVISGFVKEETRKKMNQWNNTFSLPKDFQLNIDWETARKTVCKL